MNAGQAKPTDARVVLIVEPHSRGHRLHYVAFLISDCRAKGDRVVLLTTEAAVESAEWRVHLSKYNPTVVLHPADSFSLPDISAAAASMNACVTILPDADRYISPVLRQGWKGPGRLTMLVMRDEVQPGPPLAFMRPAKTLAKRALILSADLRKRVRVYVLRSPLVPRRGPLRWVAEPVSLSCSPHQTQALREQLDHAQGRYWLGVCGDITARKNLTLIVEAIREIPNLGLLTAGPIDPDVAAATAPLLDDFVANGGLVKQIGGPLSDAEFDSAISAVDCIVAAHSNEAPSSVVLKAAASGRRLVLAGARSLRRDALHLRDQAVWSPLEANALRSAIQQARRSQEPIAAIEAGHEEFVKALTWR